MAVSTVMQSQDQEKPHSSQAPAIASRETNDQQAIYCLQLKMNIGAMSHVCTTSVSVCMIICCVCEREREMKRKRETDKEMGGGGGGGGTYTKTAIAAIRRNMKDKLYGKLK